MESARLSRQIPGNPILRLTPRYVSYDSIHSTTKLQIDGYGIDMDFAALRSPCKDSTLI